MADAFTYRAFISYSHRDAAWCDWLHKGLERYRVPRRLVGSAGRDGPVPKTLFPIFRDREELPSADDLSTQITSALEKSPYLIVMCSPSSAGSLWVNEEILAFTRLGRADRVLAVIVDGTPPESATAEPEAAHCYPQALKLRLGPDGPSAPDRAAPLVVADARPEGDGREQALLKLIAELLGVGYDELKQREIEAARRRTRIYQAVTGSMAVLAIAAVAEGVLAYRSEQRATAMVGRAVSTAGLSISSTMRLTNLAGIPHQFIEAFLKTSDQQLTALSTSGVNTPTLQVERAKVLDQFAVYYRDLADRAGESAAATRARDIYADLYRRAPDSEDYAKGLARDEGFVGEALRFQGDLDGALAAQQREAAIHRKLLAAHPSDRTHQVNVGVDEQDLGLAFLARQEFPQALESLRGARAAFEQLAAGASSDPLYQLYVEKQDRLIGAALGDAKNPARDLAAALQSYRAGLAIATDLYRRFPKNTEYEHEAAMLNGKVGDTLLAQGDGRAALSVDRATEQQYEYLTMSDIEHPAWQKELALRKVATGDALDAIGRSSEAIESYKLADAFLQVLMNHDPARADAPGDQSFAWGRMIGAYLHMNKPVEALAAMQMKLTIDEKRMAARPADAGLQLAASSDVGAMAETMINRGRAAAARPYLTRAEALLATATKGALSPADRQTAKELGDSYRALEATVQKRAPHK